MGFLNDLQTHEILGKVLNAGKDALKVDIDNATITAGSLEVNLDNANDDVLIYSNTAKDGSGTNYTPLLDSDGHLQVDVLSVTSSNVQGINAEGGALPNPVLIAGDDGTDLKNINVDATTGDVQVDVTNTVTVDGSGVTQPVSGTVTANLSATDNAVLDSIDSDTSAIKTAVEIIDNAISGSEMQVDIVADGAGLATSANQSTTNTHLGNMLYGTGLDITAVHGGSNQSLGSTYQSLFIGVGGDVVVTLATSGTDFTFKNVASGQLLPIQITDVKANNTTATNMIAMKA